MLARLVSPAAVLGVSLAVPTVYAEPRVSTDAKTGMQLYAESCAACHGNDGRGMGAATVGFETPLPDFTDCSFATREPDEDWLAVVHDGGPARAFDRIMPAYRDALSREEMQLVLDHLRTLCGDGAWPRGELNLPRPLVTEKAFPEDETVLTMTTDLEGAGTVTPRIVYERRIGARHQVEVAAPFVFAERTEGDWIGGVGDLSIAAKSAIFHSHRTGSIISVAAEIVVPTGDHDKGFGSGTTVFEPYVAVGQLLPAAFFLQFQAGVELPADRDRTDEGFWRIDVGRTFVQGLFGRSWSPMAEFLGTRELTSSESTQWSLAPQLQVSLSTRQHILVSAGVVLPLTDAQSRDAQLVTYVLWDWFDGGLLSGW